MWAKADPSRQNAALVMTTSMCCVEAVLTLNETCQNPTERVKNDIFSGV